MKSVSIFVGLLVAVCGNVGATESAADFNYPIIDLHTHVFNVRYSPVRGIAESRGVWPSVSAIIEKLVYSACGKSDLSDGVTKSAASHLNKLRSFSMDEITSTLGLDDDEPLENVLFRWLNVDKLNPEEKKELLSFAKSLSPDTESIKGIIAGGAAWAENEGTVLDPAALARILDKAEILKDEHFLDSAADANYKAKGIGFDRFYLRLLAILLQNEITIGRTLEGEYPDASLFVHHMMDMEAAYGEVPDIEFSEQIVRMRNLNEIFGGKLLMFVAFDPFRGKDAMRFVQMGLANGAIGVKFYPPSGYLPAKNSEREKPEKPALLRQWESRYKHNPPDVLNATLESFFAFCASNKVPIFTHCTPHGFYAAPDYGTNSNPLAWRPVLEKHPDLILCFGHAGGGEGWATSKEWPTKDHFYSEEVYKLCVEYENVYCELAYIDEVFNSSKRYIIQKRLTELFKKDERRDNTFRFSKKIMYGSDWHMIAVLNKRKAYLNQFREIFSAPELQAHAKDFFGGNAVKFLGLADLPVGSKSVKSSATEKAVRKFRERFGE